MVGHLLDLVRGVVLIQDGLVLLLRGQDDPVGGLDAHGGGARGHGREGVLDLDKLARGAAKGKRREG